MDYNIDMTIFTIPKAFKGEYGIMQENAIQSWRSLGVRDIMLFGNEEGIAEACQRLGCIQKAVHLDEEFNVPRIDTTFRDAQVSAVTALMAFVNTDIIFGPEFARAVEIVAAELERFLIVGQRTNVDFAEPVDFSNEAWWEKLREFALKNGKRGVESDLDFFVFPKDKVFHGCTDRPLNPETAGGRIQPYIIGRTIWDSALLWIAMLQNIPTVDVTPAVLAFHPHTVELRVKRGPAYDRNRHFGGHAKIFGRTNLTTWELTKDWKLHERSKRSC